MNNNLSTQAEGPWTYKQACEIIAELKVIGVDSGVTVGGIWLTFDLEKHGPAVVQIIKRHKGAFCFQTMMQALTLESAQQAYMKNAISRLEKLFLEGDR